MQRQDASSLLGAGVAWARREVVNFGLHYLIGGRKEHCSSSTTSFSAFAVWTAQARVAGTTAGLRLVADEQQNVEGKQKSDGGNLPKHFVFLSWFDQPPLRRQGLGRCSGLSWSIVNAIRTPTRSPPDDFLGIHVDGQLEIGVQRSWEGPVERSVHPQNCFEDVTRLEQVKLLCTSVVFPFRRERGVFST
jgi:hypothetical protein